MSTKMGMASGLTDFYVPDRLEILFDINADQVFGGFLCLVNLMKVHTWRLRLGTLQNLDSSI